MANFTFPHGVGLGEYAYVINYTIHDNMGEPYRVQVDTNNKTLKLFMRIWNETTQKQSEKFLPPVFHYSGIWIGIDTAEPQWSGNNILFSLVNTGDDRKTHTNDTIYSAQEPIYIWIGNRGIQQVFFPPGETILTLFSPVGNNDVPYPYVVGKKNVYLLLENHYLSVSTVGLPSLLAHHGQNSDENDIYDYYYHNDKLQWKKMRKFFELANRECPYKGNCVLKLPRR